MKNKILFALLATCISIPAIAQDEKIVSNTSSIINNKGEEIGTLTLKDGGNGTLSHIEIKAGGLAPGWHAVHFHSVGDCTDHDMFKHSMAHVNFYNKKHGILNSDGYEEGDLTNIYAFSDGSAAADIFSAGVRLEEGKDKALRDKDGSALIIHENADDYSSQPIGGAGNRVACSVIEPLAKK